MSKVTDLFARAQRSLAGGVSSSTRVNRALGHPLYFARADGCRLWDLDGREYIDLCCSHGATLVGHGDARIRAAVERALATGAACSYENELQTELAELVCAMVPACERVRFVGSGTEATMHAIRLARAYTGKPKLLKIEGNFHGYHDQVMFSIGTPADQLGPESSPTAWAASSGMAPGLAEQLVLVPYNRPDLLKAALERHAHELAAVICEPIYFNAGCIRPTPEFLAALRDEPRRHGVLLMFDEVLAAFRMAPGGAQQYLGVTPDLCTLGKAVGGGYPLSVFGGRREIMEKLMPTGDCQHSGTYNGHPTSVAAAIAALKIYGEPGFYEHIGAIGAELFAGMNELFARYDVPGRVEGLGARFGIYFGDVGALGNYRDAVRHDRSLMLRFIRGAIDNGVYFHDYGGGACHHGFCAAMTSTDVREALERLEPAVASLVVAAEAATV
ncbi:MAG: aspartate aminotransferase family protein [Planctomycetaceae bacterium]|nr:aspartate aminotransferase family protein [Planctomycetaceae bacterium]